MIKGIGCDIVEHSTTKNLNWDSDVTILKRIFSQNELNINSSQDLKFLSGRFAAKEAVLKCIGLGMQDGISLTDIEILQTSDGKPYLKLKDDFKNTFKLDGSLKWNISISHSSNFSIAVAIVED